MADRDKVASLLRRYDTLLQDRGQWVTHWDDLARVMLPRRFGFAEQVVEGDRRTDNLFDGTPMQAARGLANAVSAMLRPEGRRWFEIRANEDEADEADEGRVWLEDAAEVLRGALENPRARFRQATGEVDQDLVVLGTGIMYVGEARSLDHLLFQSIHLKDAAVFFSEEGAPQGLFRSRKFTLRQARDRFGEDALSNESRRRLSEGRLDDKIDIVHAVVPREEGFADAMMARNLPVASLWIERDRKHLLTSSGFHEFPFVVPRWDSSSGENYGRSPGMIALPDADTLQAMGETLLVAGQRAADPPLMAPNDGSFHEANTFPGGLSYYDIETASMVGGNPFFPLETGSHMPLTFEMQGSIRDQVFAAFFRNILNLPVGGPQMTATEVLERKEEFIREIGPVFGRLETDYTAPMIERAFSILLRAGALPPIPEVLQGRSIRFEYESPVKRIRQQVEAGAARMWVMEHIEAAGATGREEILDLIDFDAYTRFAAEANGIPHQLIRGADVVAQIRDARNQQMAQQAQMMEIQQGVEMAKTGAEAASRAGLTGAA